MSDINIGEKISLIRKKQNLSIRDLAKLAEVTPSLLSQIERGLANPSVNSLKSILDIKKNSIFIKDFDGNFIYSKYSLKYKDKVKNV